MKQEQVNIEVVSIDDLIQDDHNFNKGNEQGAQLLELWGRRSTSYLIRV